MPTPRYTYFIAHAAADRDRARTLYDLLQIGGQRRRLRLDAPLAAPPVKRGSPRAWSS